MLEQWITELSRGIKTTESIQGMDLITIITMIIIIIIVIIIHLLGLDLEGCLASPDNRA
jgi:hypothetical protein